MQPVVKQQAPARLQGLVEQLVKSPTYAPPTDAQLARVRAPQPFNPMQHAPVGFWQGFEEQLEKFPA